MVRSYQEQVTLTVQEQLARADANGLFKQGDIKGAAAAYEGALAVTVLDENRLPLLANLGLCRLRLSEFAAAAEGLAVALDLGVACYAAPNLALKAAGRRLEACQQLGDEAGARAAIADCSFFLQRSREKCGLAPPKLDLPPEPSAEAVTDLLMAVGGAEDDGGLNEVQEPHPHPNPNPNPNPNPSPNPNPNPNPTPSPSPTPNPSPNPHQVRRSLTEAKPESLDAHRMHALALTVHVECMRPALRGELLSLLLEGGAPPDARVPA